MDERIAVVDNVSLSFFTANVDNPTGLSYSVADSGPSQSADSSSSEMIQLLRQIARTQNRLIAVEGRQTEILEEIADTLSAGERQRSTDLARWKQDNPRLARACKAASEKLAQVQRDYIDQIADEIDLNFDNMLSGEFVFNDFVDRFGPRFIHLNTLLQMLSQLSIVSENSR